MRAAALAALAAAGCALAQAPAARLPFALDGATPAWRAAVDPGATTVTLAVLRVHRPARGLQTLRLSLACGPTPLWQHDLALYPPDAPLRFTRPLWAPAGPPAGCAPELRLGFGGAVADGWPAVEGEVQVTR